MTVASRYPWAIAVLGLGIGIAAMTWQQDFADVASSLSSQDWVFETVSRADPWLVVALIAFAIVASPIPNGPIALAAGALYGTVEGGLLVLAGAVLGAMIAFGLSRWFGRRALSVSSHSIAVWLTRPRSQNMLMLAVLGTRLVPFVSFDAVSYVAGLTSLAAWRFALATVLGAMPVSVGLAGLGAGMVEANSWMIAAAVACAVTFIVPVGTWLWRRTRNPSVAARDLRQGLADEPLAERLTRRTEDSSLSLESAGCGG